MNAAKQRCPRKTIGNPPHYAINWAIKWRMWMYWIPFPNAKKTLPGPRNWPSGSRRCTGRNAPAWPAEPRATDASVAREFRVQRGSQNDLAITWVACSYAGKNLFKPNPQLKLVR